MKPGWVVVWRGKSCVVYLDEEGGWSLDPDLAKVFRFWAHAKVAAGVNNVARCWTSS